MANERIDLTIAEKFGLLLPEFSGVENELHSLIKSAEQYLFMFMNKNKLFKNYYFAVVKSKLIDRALAEVSTSDIPDRWETLKNFSNLKFGDQINLDVLIQQLQFLNKKPDEDLLNFIDKVISMKIRINYQIDADPMPDPQRQLYKLNILKISTFNQTVTTVKNYHSNMVQYELLD
ncbi:hypothetical protein HHI36_019709 [Cryptolaemus montrouzieri]|uniref:Uncharacterized protein n=1 Tax=Cryptolaemus montrouzieri TaxID=559131 RepID=A0ABD2N9P0_9CUCU